MSRISCGAHVTRCKTLETRSRKENAALQVLGDQSSRTKLKESLSKQKEETISCHIIVVSVISVHHVFFFNVLLVTGVRTWMALKPRMDGTVTQMNLAHSLKLGKAWPHIV